MPRMKKDNHPITIRLASEIFEQLETFCEQSGQSKTTAVERALLMYIDDYNKKQEVLKASDK